MCVLLMIFPSCLCVLKGKPDLNTSLPVRQTASIFKQPVTKVTNHPSNKVKTDPQKAVDQPRQARPRPLMLAEGLWQLGVMELTLSFRPQLFWEKKLSGLNAYDIAEELVRTMELPKGLQGAELQHPLLQRRPPLKTPV